MKSKTLNLWQFAVVFAVLALAGCASRAKPAPSYAAPIFTPGDSGAKARPAPSAQIHIIHIRPEARDYVHP